MLSYVHGPEAPLLEETINQAFMRTVTRRPDHEALVVPHQSVRMTWSQVDAEVNALACGLRGLGLRPGDRVGIWSASCREWILLQLATARTRTVLVNINPAYRSHELRYVIAKSSIRSLFLWEKDDRANYGEILLQAAEGTESTLRDVIYFGQESWHRMVARGGDLLSEKGDCEEVVNMQYTSGTTGSPKGVLLTHRNILNNGNLIAACLRATEQDSICIPVPMYHCFGCVMGTMTWILCGGVLVIPAPRFDALATLKAVEAERATILYGVPAMFIAELEHPEFARFDVKSLRTGIMAGAPCPIEVMKRVMTDMHCSDITIAYGQTESSPVITMSSVNDPVNIRVETVGRTMPNTEVKIVAPSGEVVPVDEQGELCTRGYLVMKGYDQDPEATARAIDNEGWLHTGDLATMRADGCIRITGRAKDMIIRGGENISPREVEEFLHTHPKIAEVQVVGVPDRKLGETLAVWIRLRSGESASEQEIRDYCKGRIAYFKIPQYVRFVDAFPMTVSGKVQKFRIRETEIKERGLDDLLSIQTA
jgi:fatty-acyl-CoA synthase